MDGRGKTETRNSVLSREAGGCLFLLWFSSFAAGEGDRREKLNLRSPFARQGFGKGGNRTGKGEFWWGRDNTFVWLLKRGGGGRVFEGPPQPPLMQPLSCP